MEKRWNVYHAGHHLGLKTAKEIRDALRQGTLDPFDKVAAEGSTIHEELIEVDEIFREPTSYYHEPAKEYPRNSEDRGETTTAVASGYNSQHTQIARALPLPPRPKQEEPHNYNNLEALPKDPAQKNSSKRYYLIDKDKVLGPLSALEIQSLFNRNMLNPKVRVQRIGSSKTILIAQFIDSYSGDRLKELAEDGKIPNQIGVGSPSSKVMNELSRMASSQKVARYRKNRTYSLMASLGILLSVSLYIAYERMTSTELRSASEEVTDDEEAVTELEDHKKQPRIVTRPRLIQSSKTTENTRVTPKEVSIKAPTEKRVVKDIKLEVPPPKTIRPQTIARKEEPAKRIETRAPREAADNKPSQRSASTISIKPTPQVLRAPSPIARAMENSGRIQTIGPLNFSLASLESCSSKCTLTLVDDSGASMQAVFFKSAYYDLLKLRSKGVQLTGNTKLEKGVLTLYIQDIR